MILFIENEILMTECEHCGKLSVRGECISVDNQIFCPFCWGLVGYEWDVEEYEEEQEAFSNGDV